MGSRSDFHQDRGDSINTVLPVRPKSSTTPALQKRNQLEDDTPYQYSLPIRTMAGKKRKAEEQASNDNLKRPNLGPDGVPAADNQQADLPDNASLTADAAYAASKGHMASGHDMDGRIAAPPSRKKQKSAQSATPQSSTEEAGQASITTGMPADEEWEWDGSALIPDSEFQVKPKSQTFDFGYSEGEETEAEVPDELLTHQELLKRMKKQRMRKQNGGAAHKK
ncbi:uncharacterized protein EI97DRAFT_479308 [Westerdykella ornata]|uniref:Uncharacterized protein n=1 Tax=Westerdykella ornata TaxID=318751 RepID=A0A6A6JD29_WESOR|nr:uncharacterized protein EI97DRAFT_479308 [Westerdykella ornata]KAF2274083.1 hypothetical protein EI97DRAFT_479308 [Westerdykella ornata]